MELKKINLAILSCHNVVLLILKTGMILLDLSQLNSKNFFGWGLSSRR